MEKYDFLENRMKMFFRNSKSLTRAFHQAAELFLKHALRDNLTHCHIIPNSACPCLTISVKKETGDVFYGIYYLNTAEVGKSTPIELFESELNYLQTHFHDAVVNMMNSLSEGEFKTKIT